jgi:hypothetical protein
MPTIGVLQGWFVERKRRDGEMLRSRITAVVMVVALLALTGGCAMFATGPSDEEMIAATMDTMFAATAAQDLDKMMALYSEDYMGENGEGKAEVRDFLAEAIDMGYMEELKVTSEEMKITVEGDTATAGPVGYDIMGNELSIAYNLKKEDGTWRIVGSAMEY